MSQVRVSCEIAVCFVVLIRDTETGGVVFWHRQDSSDLLEMLTVWRKPIGGRPGTWLEVWKCGQSVSTYIYDRLVPRRWKHAGAYE
jgi:hypothetical protein